MYYMILKIIGSGNGVSENNTGSKDVLTAALHVVKGNSFQLIMQFTKLILVIYMLLL